MNNDWNDEPRDGAPTPALTRTAPERPDIYQYPAPELAETANPVFPDGLPNQNDRQQLADLLASRFQRGVAGIAATQLGIPWRAIAMHFPNAGGIVVLFDPTITNTGGRLTVEDERCLSVRDTTGNMLRIPVARWDRITIEWRDVTGEQFAADMGGLHARIAQHEIDHLDGITIWDRAAPTSRQQRRHLDRSRPDGWPDHGRVAGH